jgi:hypothetical protein
MKNFNRVFVGLLLAFGLMAVVSMSHAAGIAISPKQTFELSYTTTVSTVTPVPSSTSAAAYSPGAVYEVIQSTGASGEYFEMYDSSVTTSINCGQITSQLPAGQTMLSARLIFSSTTANTITRFDPPLAFMNGLVVCDSAVTGQTSVTYELGRGLSGQ